MTSPTIYSADGLGCLLKLVYSDPGRVLSIQKLGIAGKKWHLDNAALRVAIDGSLSVLGNCTDGYGKEVGLGARFNMRIEFNGPMDWKVTFPESGVSIQQVLVSDAYGKKLLYLLSKNGVTSSVSGSKIRYKGLDLKPIFKNINKSLRKKKLFLLVNSTRSFAVV